MMPLLPFVAGLFAGAAAVSALRSERARSAIDDTGSRLRAAVSEAQSGVRAAAQSGLAMLHRTPAQTIGDAEEAAAAAFEVVSSEPPPKKPARTSKAAPLTALDETPVKAKPRRAPRKPKTAETEA